MLAPVIFVIASRTSSDDVVTLAVAELRFACNFNGRHQHVGTCHDGSGMAIRRDLLSTTIIILAVMATRPVSLPSCDTEWKSGRCAERKIKQHLRMQASECHAAASTMPVCVDAVGERLSVCCSNDRRLRRCQSVSRWSAEDWRWMLKNGPLSAD
jgi:hypothetical protein